jgi:Nif-specific regulatory protein
VAQNLHLIVNKLFDILLTRPDMPPSADQTLPPLVKDSVISARTDRSRWAREERLILRLMAKLATQSLNEGRAIFEVLHLMSELIGLNRGRVLLQNEPSGARASAIPELRIRYFYGLTRAQAVRGRFAPNEGITGAAFASGRVVIVQDIDAEPEYLARTVDRAELPQETVSYIAVPFEIEGRTAGVLAAHRLRHRDRALADDLDLMHIIAAWIAQVLTVNRLVERRTAVLQNENRSLRAQLDQRSAGAAIIGSSAVLLSALKQVEQVAPSDATVLLLGESGTGKELFAHALHSGSARAKAPFIKVNCGAIPESLFESELFGHEKGAFTGALARRIGRIEQAHQGTLFLDEIGDMPLAMQVKLLRVLQERIIERVGGAEPISVNIRIVAATHRDLTELTARGLFRLDLFYRLSVIPIRLPALRERIEDIPAMVWHHLAEINLAYGKQATLSRAAITAMSTYFWPGNVRQLRNAIERLVLLGDYPSRYAPEISEQDVVALLATSTAPATKTENTSPSFTHTLSDVAVIVHPPTHCATQILTAIATAAGNKSRAAQALGLTLRQLNYRLRKMSNNA